MTGRARGRDRDESPALRAAQDRDRHVRQVSAYRFFAPRTPRRATTVLPAPLRYWQFDPARPRLVLAVVVVLAAWLGLLAWWLGPDEAVAESPIAIGLGLAMIAASTTRLTVSDAGLSTDVAGMLKPSATGVVTLGSVREVVRGTAPAGWPRAKRRGGWWPGRTPVTVRYVNPDDGAERALTVRVRDAEAFAEALGRPLG